MGKESTAAVIIRSVKQIIAEGDKAVLSPDTAGILFGESARIEAGKYPGIGIVGSEFYPSYKDKWTTSTVLRFGLLKGRIEVDVGNVLDADPSIGGLEVYTDNIRVAGWLAFGMGSDTVRLKTEEIVGEPVRKLEAVFGFPQDTLGICLTKDSVVVWDRNALKQRG